MPTLTSMSSSECWQQLGERGVGRIGFDRGRGPRIHPVDYAVHDRRIYVRTSRDSELADFVAMFGDGALVSFEVDQVTDVTDGRWSVLIAARIDTPPTDGEEAALEQPTPTPSGHRGFLVRLSPVEVTGRRLVEVPRGVTSRSTGGSS
ncbi:pyridoxamine 5'-phosphate oxidase family protein [Nocardioides coralli]|uniref:pyridoxamine 5'-phosphate oxidase family protein n=1 Tax=Nocardioides coralli TaxID=2872154 RepID=UPI001CA3D3D0|nr:pyridoxamine 5'-phosphate oxidase family protein [Nocardioides coralli]QZY30366.1 pyridoxamine 5'-phosphate oxidase family protein [Nocardioides coralli]